MVVGAGDVSKCDGEELNPVNCAVGLLTMVTGRRGLQAHRAATDKATAATVY